MAASQSSDCQLSDAIQNLPPELREKIYKDYVTIQLRQSSSSGWKKMHENILKLPFCNHMHQIVPMIICFDYSDRCFEGCCFPCYQRMETRIHKVALNSHTPMDQIPMLENNKEYKNFLKVCSWDSYDWHEWLLENEGEKRGLSQLQKAQSGFYVIHLRSE